MLKKITPYCQRTLILLPTICMEKNTLQALKVIIVDQHCHLMVRRLVTSYFKLESEEILAS